MLRISGGMFHYVLSFPKEYYNIYFPEMCYSS